MPVFENADFIVIDKPAGMLSVPGRGETATPRRVLGLELQAARGIRIFPVHRLDFAVSGLVLFATHAAAHARANAWFERRQVGKTYRAWSEAQTTAHLPANVPRPAPLALRPGDCFEWHGRILRNKRRAFQGLRGKPSLTLATYLGPHPGTGLLRWDLRPVTGRPHQLRLDLSRHGFPIAGDALYGSRFPDHYGFSAERIALRAYRLDFSAVPAAERGGLPEVLEVAAEWECLE